MRFFNILSRDAYLRESAAACDYPTLFAQGITQSQQCALAQSTSCQDIQDMVNFFEFYFCTLQANSIVFGFLALFILYLIFKNIQATVEEYIAPSITYISEWLKLSEPFAAVTLIALANGAGDVITALVASGTDGAIEYNVGSLFGAGLFCCSVVVSVSIWNSPNDIQVEPATIYRDVGIYIFACLLTISFAVQGFISLVSSILLLALYFLLVAIVVFQGDNDKQEDEQELVSQTKSTSMKDTILNVNPDVKFHPRYNRPIRISNDLKKKFKKALRVLKMKYLFVNSVKNALEYKLKQKEIDSQTDFYSKDTIDQIDYALQYPFTIARHLTILPCEEEHYNKYYSYVWPFTGILFIFWALFQTPQMWWLTYGAPISIVLFLFFFITQRKNFETQVPSYFILISILGAFSGLLWTYVVSDVLIDLLTMVGVVCKLSTTYLSLTILAIGNALPDALTTIALAKQGYALMGLTGTYAGQLFGLLIGFGLSMLKKTASDGSQTFNIFSNFEKNFMLLLVIGASLLNLIITFVFGIKNKFYFTTPLANTCFALYAIFFILATADQISMLV